MFGNNQSKNTSSNACDKNISGLIVKGAIAKWT